LDALLEVMMELDQNARLSSGHDEGQTIKDLRLKSLLGRW
jgi:hypothetical protein